MNTDELRDALRRDAELAGLPPTDLVHRVAGLRRRSSRRRAAVVGCVVATVAALVGVSALDGLRHQDGNVDEVAVIDPEVAAAAYRESIANTNGSAAASYSIGPESLTEFLPNTTYRVRNGARTTLTDAVVVGHVTTVTPGRAFHYSDDEHSTVEMPFDDPRAMWRTAHAQATVTEVLGGQVQEDTIVVGFGAGPDFDVLAAGLPALGDLVFFLETESAVYAYEPGIWSVAFDGSVLAEVAADGRLTLPAVEPYWAEQWLAQTPTLDSLRAAAQQPPREVPFETLED